MIDFNNISPEQEKIVAILKDVYDPEIPVNIWEMGLIYDIQVNEHEVYILMTLTAPNCPVAETLPSEVKNRVMSIPGITSVKVDITFEPMWDIDRMSPAARLELGLD
ncbi:MAG: DUF59 domain-containing protein [Bacteroidales bacterium]|jgi:FeS assembly SUF system protein|nr:DUF59 domain-containing protein [Bacteroidales bacterium]MBQ4478405.1 DUF59 domain-containing protein [Bacteroidales bacterium]MBR4453882.1 DUF59 domain-containing protein [Bacteroidales bacterium]MCR5554542.1 iron-sulfur cluster assembly protein [Bacteroidales bacterium]